MEEGNNSMDQFLDRMIDEKGYTSLQGEGREALKEDLSRTLLMQIDRAAINELSEEKAAELSNKLDDPNFTEEDAANFIKAAGVDMEEVALTTMLQFRELYLGEVKVEANESES